MSVRSDVDKRWVNEAVLIAFNLGDKGHGMMSKDRTFLYSKGIYERDELPARVQLGLKYSMAPLKGNLGRGEINDKS